MHMDQARRQAPPIADGGFDCRRTANKAAVDPKSRQWRDIVADFLHQHHLVRFTKKRNHH